MTTLSIVDPIEEGPVLPREPLLGRPQGVQQARERHRQEVAEGGVEDASEETDVHCLIGRGGPRHHLMR